MQVNGGLIARGTAGQRITFTSTAVSVVEVRCAAHKKVSRARQASPSAGSWESVLLAESANQGDTSVEFCDFLYGGGGSSAAALIIQRTGLQIRDSRVLYSAADALGVSKPTQLVNSQFSNSAGNGITFK
jgi:hypothetical protein